MSKPTHLFMNVFLLFFFLFLSTSLCQYSEADKKGTRTLYLIRHGEYNISDTSDAKIGKN